MIYHGHVKNGQIVLDEPARLAEGTPVKIAVVETADAWDGSLHLLRQRRARRIRLDADLARQIASLAEFHPDES